MLLLPSSAIAATRTRLAVLAELERDAHRSGAGGLFTVGSLAWGRWTTVTAASDADVYVLGTPDALQRLIQTSPLLARDAPQLQVLVAYLARHADVDMASAKIHLGSLPLSTLFLLTPASWVQLTTRPMPQGDFQWRLHNLRPMYALQVKGVSTFGGELPAISTPFDPVDPALLPLQVRRDLAYASVNGTFQSQIFLSHLLTLWPLWDPTGMIHRGAGAMTRRVGARAGSDGYSDPATALLTLTGVATRMPPWLQQVWVRRFTQILTTP